MMVVVIDMQPDADLPEVGNAWAVAVGDMCMEPRRHQR